MNIHRGPILNHQQEVSNLSRQHLVVLRHYWLQVEQRNQSIMYWVQYQMIVDDLTQVFCGNLEQQFILHNRHQIICICLGAPFL